MTPMEDDRYPRFVFAAPDDDPTGWGLTYERIEESLRDIDPRARTARAQHPPRNEEFLSFELTFPFGWVEGHAFTRHNSLSLTEATLATATGVATWLRAVIVPPGAGIESTYLEAIELGIPPTPLPSTDAPTLLRQALHHHIQAVQAVQAALAGPAPHHDE
jgi:hypothetical protein